MRHAAFFAPAPPRGAAPGAGRRAAAARRHLAMAALAALAAAAACVAAGPERTPPQGWWRGFGPVIPHDRFPADCTLCHESGSWNRIRADFAFDHERETGRALAGAHAAAQCLRCHNDRGPADLFAARGCAGCHEDVHLGQLGSDCSACHGEESWLPRGQLALHDRTRFPLVGAHAATPCFRCHPGAEVGVFRPVDTECISCHRADLGLARAPDHAASGWIDDCERCHVPTSWTGAGFNHAFWPLTGAHAALSCDRCHAGASFAGAPRACYGCHAGDYLAASDPDHAAAGLPTRCQICHGTSAWRPASFGHPDFPIDRGLHGRLQCAECHTTPGSFRAFSCIDCHAHRCPEMNDKHRDEPGYACQSSACYSCHPNGRAED